MGNNGYDEISARMAGATQNSLLAMLKKLTGGPVDKSLIADLAINTGEAFVDSLQDMRGEPTKEGGVSKDEKED